MSHDVRHGGVVAGIPVRWTEAVADLRARCLAGLARLPKTYRQINRTAVYPVRYTKRLEALLEKLRRRIRRSALK